MSTVAREEEGFSGEKLRRAMRLVTIAWLGGSVWSTATAGSPLTVFPRALGASEFQMGLLSALPFLLALASLPASLLIEATGKRKLIFLVGLYINRALWFAIAVVPIWIGLERQRLALSVFLWLMVLMHLGQGVGGPAWISWMADIVPERLRSRYFTYRRQVGLFVAIPAAVATGWVLDHRSNPGDATMTMKYCAGIFIVAAVFGLLDIHCFHYLDEPTLKKCSHSTLASLKGPLRDRHFLWFAGFVATMFFAISFMGQFVTLYLLERVGVSNTGTQLMLLVAPMFGQLISLRVWGHAADRVGKKPLLAICCLALVPIGFGWVFVGEHNQWLGYALSALGALFWAGVETVNFNLVIDMADEGGTGYVAINSVIVNIAGCLGGISAGIMAQSLRNFSWAPIESFKPITFYELLFILSGFMRLAAVLIFLPMIHEPTARPWHEAIRFMYSNIYDNLFSAADQD